jgi:L-lactate dehydrogenase complex protein LldG
MSTQDNARARADILARLREAAPASRGPAPGVDAYYAGLPQPDPASATGRFAERARSWRAEVIDCTRATWPQALVGVVAAKGIGHLLAGRDTPLHDGLAAVAASTQLVWYDTSIDTFKPTLFDRIDAGITTTRGGIAETGSLILWPDANEPRTLSLVPPIHIAVLHANDLHETLHAAMRAQGWAARMPTNALLVTGPSKTADIQRLLVYGAHGPKQLIVLLVREETGA